MAAVTGRQVEECSQNWNKTGRNDLLKILLHTFSESSKNSNNESLGDSFKPINAKQSQSDGRAYVPQNLNLVSNGGAISSADSSLRTYSPLYERADTHPMQRLLFDIVYYILHKVLKVEQAVQLFSEALAALETSANNSTANELLFTPYSFLSSLADIFFIFDNETQVSEEILRENGRIRRQTYYELVQACRYMVTDALLKTRLSEETLEAVGIIQSKNVFTSKYIKTRTRLLFRQQKFNLLREENEGYAKTIVELISVPQIQLLHNGASTNSTSTGTGSKSGGTSSASGTFLSLSTLNFWRMRAEISYEHIQSLIGCFDLDANRVLDIILDVFEQRLDAFVYYLELLKLFVQCERESDAMQADGPLAHRLAKTPDPSAPTLSLVGQAGSALGPSSSAATSPETFAQLVGRKFQLYNSDPSRTPGRLYFLTALLLQNGLIDLELLCPHFSPKDSETLADYKADSKAFTKAMVGDRWKALESTTLDEIATNTDKSSSSAASATNTASSSAPAGGDSSKSSNQAKTPNETSASIPAPGTNPSDIAALNELLSRRLSDCESKSQKISLLTALIRICDWRDARFLLERLPQAPDIILYQPRLLRAISELVNYLLDPLYARDSGSEKSQTRKSVGLKITTEDFVSEEMPLDRELMGNSSDSQSNASKAPNDELLKIGEIVSYFAHSHPAEQNTQSSLALLLQLGSIQELPRFVSQVLEILGPFAFTDARLVSKMIRISKNALNIPSSKASEKQDSSKGKEKEKEKIVSKESSGTSSLVVTQVQTQVQAQSQRTAQSMLPIDGNYQAVFNLLDSFLLPILSLSTADADTVEDLAGDLWSCILRYLPYDHRYRLYGQWKNANYSSCTMMQAKKRAVTDRVKYIMKRLTKENVKSYGKQLAELANSNPTIVVDIILGQIEKYDNLINPVIESLRYVSDITYDSFGYCIIERLADSSRQSSKLEELNLAQWIQSIGSFTGGMVRRYPTLFDVTGILQYVLNHLKAGLSTDLIVMSEIIQKMAGIEMTEDLTEAQIEALCGGEVLQQEFGSFQAAQYSTGTGGDTSRGSASPLPAGASSHNLVASSQLAKASSTQKKALAKLREVFMEQDVLIAFIILLCQHREMLLYGPLPGLVAERKAALRRARASEARKKPLEVDLAPNELVTLATDDLVQDEDQDMNQIMEEAAGQGPLVLPEFRHMKLLGRLYDQCQDTLVQCIRFAHQLIGVEELSRSSGFPSLLDLMQNYSATPDVVFNLWRPLFSQRISNLYAELKKQDKKNKADQPPGVRYVEASHLIMSEVCDSIQPQFPIKIWDDISVKLYVTFWSLSMNDLYVPTAAYEKHIQGLKLQLEQISKGSGSYSDQSEKQLKKSKEAVSALLERLESELRRQQEHTSQVMQRLRAEKDDWLQVVPKNSSSSAQHNSSSARIQSECITQLLQLCLFPRLCFSTLDALYAARFVHIMHQLKTPNFSSILFFDRVFCDVINTLTACTENEAQRYGRFLLQCLVVIDRWHSSKDIYDKECFSFPGFLVALRKESSAKSSPEQLDYENYRHLCHKWHFKLTRSFNISLDAGSYAVVRNSLIVLIKIIPQFPKVSNLASFLEKRMDKLKQEEKDKRPDIYALATGYAGMLKNRKNALLPESEYHRVANPQPASEAKQVAQDAADGARSAQSASKESDLKEKSLKSDKDQNSRPSASANASTASISSTTRSNSSLTTTMSSSSSQVQSSSSVAPSSSNAPARSTAAMSNEGKVSSSGTMTTSSSAGATTNKPGPSVTQVASSRISPSNTSQATLKASGPSLDTTTRSASPLVHGHGPSEVRAREPPRTDYAKSNASTSMPVAVASGASQGKSRELGPPPVSASSSSGTVRERERTSTGTGGSVSLSSMSSHSTPTSTTPVSMSQTASAADSTLAKDRDRDRPERIRGIPGEPEKGVTEAKRRKLSPSKDKDKEKIGSINSSHKKR